jgi:hypothetical protein
MEGVEQSTEEAREGKGLFPARADCRQRQVAACETCTMRSRKFMAFPQRMVCRCDVCLAEWLADSSFEAMFDKTGGCVQNKA